MKKLVIVMICLGFIGTSFGITLCKRTNTAVAVMNKTVGGVKTSVDNNEWVVSMNDGITVSGKALCSEMPGEKDQVNTGVADTIDTGTNCFCKMMGPATSYWVYLYGYNTAAECESGTATGCANICGDHVATDASFRSAIYEAIW